MGDFAAFKHQENENRDDKGKESVSIEQEKGAWGRTLRE